MHNPDDTEPIAARRRLGVAAHAGDAADADVTKVGTFAAGQAERGSFAVAAEAELGSFAEGVAVEGPSEPA